MIEGVKIKELKIIRDERGQVMHMMRRDDGIFAQFGEIYFSMVNPGVVKAWKKHLKMTQHVAVPKGMIRLVIFDDRNNSSSRGEVQEILTGEHNYQLVRIPPLVWYGFQCQSPEPAFIANCSDLPHDTKESSQLSLDDAQVPYQWK